MLYQRRRCLRLLLLRLLRQPMHRRRHLQRTRDFPRQNHHLILAMDLRKGCCQRRPLDFDNHRRQNRQRRQRLVGLNQARRQQK